MANSRVFFSHLKTGGCTSVVEARLLRFWEARNVKRGGELMWVDIISVDVNVRSIVLFFFRSVLDHSSGFSLFINPGKYLICFQMTMMLTGRWTSNLDCFDFQILKVSFISGKKGIVILGLI